MVVKLRTQTFVRIYSNRFVVKCHGGFAVLIKCPHGGNSAKAARFMALIGRVCYSTGKETETERMNRVQSRTKRNHHAGHARSARKLLRARFFSLSNGFLSRGTGADGACERGAFLAAAAFRRSCWAACGRLRAEALLIFWGIPAILLSGLYAAYLHRRGGRRLRNVCGSAVGRSARGGNLPSAHRSYVRVRGVLGGGARLFCGGLVAAGFCWPLTLAVEMIPASVRFAKRGS
jgi:hypothetical protein